MRPSVKSQHCRTTSTSVVAIIVELLEYSVLTWYSEYTYYIDVLLFRNIKENVEWVLLNAIDSVKNKVRWLSAEVFC